MFHNASYYYKVNENGPGGLSKVENFLLAHDRTALRQSVGKPVRGKFQVLTAILSNTQNYRVILAGTADMSSFHLGARSQ